jgi:hypothetical protein
MSKHIDLIAIAILLLAIAAFSTARRAVVMTVHGPAHYIYLDNGNRQVQVPRVPALPRISFRRD